MSYCRFGSDSDVYLYPTLRDEIVCCGCLLVGKPGEERWEHFKTPADALEHLDAHRQAGHLVPLHAIERLLREAAAK